MIHDACHLAALEDDELDENLQPSHPQSFLLRAYCRPAHLSAHLSQQTTHPLEERFLKMSQHISPDDLACTSPTPPLPWSRRSRWLPLRAPSA
ncbi:hypothetical protein HYPSUDRAFT_485091 [Hypholoma sublateritium FD-334 SS-4]|uniref:Uncharacterized protein n=1 Tax=Hypholoma sublateritium (strain FD-334 SS-4) TaxID=945553 RepID=A0A0D2LSN4_HYPSF|nr:hypothetical protein HYPSUDRAFT_485091 [Hypholoma sublateritium FD-334 SS-4]